MPLVFRFVTPVDATQCCPELIGHDQFLQVLAKARTDINAPEQKEAPPAYDEAVEAPDEPQTDLRDAVEALQNAVAALDARADDRDVEDLECRKDRADLRKRIEELERRIWTHQSFVKHKQYENLNYPDTAHYNYGHKKFPEARYEGHVKAKKLRGTDLKADAIPFDVLP